jgi:sigma-B regulation protein RsbU (phosphoserine phosphatase)
VLQEADSNTLDLRLSGAMKHIVAALPAALNQKSCLSLYPLKIEQKIAVLNTCHFFAGAEAGILETLAAETKLLSLPANEAVINKGDPGSTMYFLVSGTVRVHDGDVTLAQLSEGEVFGEMAVLDSDVRSASVSTTTEATILSLERDDLWQVVSRSPQTLRSMMSAVLQRERNIVQDVANRSRQVIAFEKDLEIGRRIQADFLPEYVPEAEGWEISSHFEAAQEVAGEVYDVFELGSSKHIALVIGDVCDKGVGAALYMTLFRSLIRASCQYGLMSEEIEVEDNSAEHMREILRRGTETTNRYIATTHSKSSMFASLFFGILNCENGELLYVNGGHESPVIFRMDGRCDVLEVTGGVLGLFPWASFSIECARLGPGDLMLAYTDGVNEAKNEQGEQFSDDRILDMNNAVWNNGSELLEKILARIRDFRGEAAQSDDITMLAVHRVDARASS